MDSPFLIALIIILLIVMIIVILMVYLSRQTKITPTSTSVAASCTVAPPVPTGLAVTNPQGDLMVLSWNTMAGATEYTAYIGNTPGFTTGQALNSVTTRFTSASFANLTLGVTYYFMVDSSNTCGISALSPQISYNLVYTFPTRFVIANQLDTIVEVCDAHDSIYVPSDECSVSKFCTMLDSWCNFSVSDNTIRQTDRPGYCLTRDGGNLVGFHPCVVNASQQWVYSAVDSSLCSYTNPGSDCLNMPAGFNGFIGQATWGPKGAPSISAWNIEAQ